MLKNKLLLLFAIVGIPVFGQLYSTGVVNLSSTSGLVMTVKLDVTTQVTMTLTGPAGRWFALGFDAASMQAGTDVVGVHSAGTLSSFDAYLTGQQAPATDPQQNWTITSDVVAGSIRTIVATRALNTGDVNDFTFSASASSISLIWARASSNSFAYSYHGGGNRGVTTANLALIPPPAAPTGNANQSFCNGATLSQLSAVGSNVQWYLVPTGGSPLPSNTPLVNGTSYYASQTVNGQVSSSRLAVLVTLNSPPAAPSAVSGAASICFSTLPLTYSVPALNGASSYVWTAPSGVTGSSNGNSISYVFSSLFTSGSLSVLAQNACGQSAATILTVVQHFPSVVNQSLTVCDTLLWNGQSYSNSGAYVYQTTNIWGCDSTVNLQLTVINISPQNFQVEQCAPYSWNGQIYSTSGSYQQNFTSAQGCDSLVTLYFNLIQNYNLQDTFSSCDAYPWNGQTLSQSGSYVYNGFSVFGCDSTVTLSFTLWPNYQTDTSITSQGPILWNGQMYSTTGSYTQTLSSQQGCDSVVTLNLTINENGVNGEKWINPVVINPIIQGSNTFVFGLPEGFDYTIYSMDGKQLVSGYSIGELNTKRLAQGNYMIVIADVKGIKTYSISPIHLLIQ